VTLEEFRKRFADRQTALELVSNPRGLGLPLPGYLSRNVEVAAIFRRLLKNGGLLEHGLSQSDLLVLRWIHQRGWVYATTENDYYTVYVLATPVHSSYLSHLLEPPSMVHGYSNLLNFCIAVMKNIKPSRLFTPLRRIGSSLDRSPEAQFEDEFYRSAHELTHGGVAFSPEFAVRGQTGIAGRVDFLLAKEKWGIELAREGSKLQQHMDRLGDEGAYASLMVEEDMADYILINCCTSVPTVKRPRKCQFVLLSQFLISPQSFPNYIMRYILRHHVASPCTTAS
jgi:hypothetical protein